MRLVRWEPFNEIATLQNEINKVFNEGVFNNEAKLLNWTPAVDVSENDTEYKIKTDLPGLSKEEIDISLVGKTLTIKGERKDSNETKVNFHKREITYGSFQKQLTFREEVSNEGIKANYTDGVLELTVPKSEKVKPRKISIE